MLFLVIKIANIASNLCQCLHIQMSLTVVETPSIIDQISILLNCVALWSLAYLIILPHD